MVIYTNFTYRSNVYEEMFSDDQKDYTYIKLITNCDVPTPMFAFFKKVFFSNGAQLLNTSIKKQYFFFLPNANDKANYSNK